MLVELECPLFGSKKEGIFKPYGKIEFHKGLNTVLGAKKADNSIGKSTFLMVIDFCFGGTDYADTRKRVMLSHMSDIIQLISLLNLMVKKNITAGQLLIVLMLTYVVQIIRFRRQFL